MLANQVDFQGRQPKPDDVIQLGMIDLLQDDRWIELAQTTAWCWQQGCMLQWLPGSKTRSHLQRPRRRPLCLPHPGREDREERTLPGPIYAVSPDAKWAIAPDFRRLADQRPGYGYNGIPDPNRDVPAPENAGIWNMDLRTGERKSDPTLAQAAAIPNPHTPDWTGAKHWFNHLLFSPDGSRFIFLHRWRVARREEKLVTRMFTVRADGKDLHVIDDYGGGSHFIWRDTRHILSWADRPPLGKKFYLYEDGGPTRSTWWRRDLMVKDGHCTYLPGNRWILNDTYPDQQRNQHPYLYNRQRKRIRWGISIRHPDTRRIALRHPSAIQSRWAQGGD